MAPDTPHTAFVLGGGGRWGAVEVGMLRALLEAGIEPDLIVGTSIGAFNGAVFAADPTAAGIERLAAMWDEVQTSEVLRSNVIERAKVLARLKVAIHDPAELRAILLRVLPLGWFGLSALDKDWSNHRYVPHP